jgi:heat shock protein HslJ
MRTLKRALVAVVTLLISACAFTPAFAGESVCVENVCRNVVELRNTVWKLVELAGKEVTQAPQQRREARINFSGEGSRLSAFGGCNQLAGGYVQEGNALRFTQMAGTMMACEPALMELEDRFLKMLDATTDYHIEGQQLILFGGDQLLARFAAVHE